ncbi:MULTISPECIES: plasmid replication DNA-binding protein [unclassified Psychrobacter]|uniref:plasmid replication DNA-binding protein n=2 Tax=Gammaproteobacteria TaxID=1236 RepID=UPI0004708EFB|nr:MULTISPECIES: plasmid replication DNA-binding protein [unclassified Psychrobacter]
MNISVTKAAKEWGVSRTTIYQKVNDGELSRTSDKKIDTSEMLRVFGEPISKKRTERSANTVQSTPLNNHSVQYNTDIEHLLALEKLKNEHLSQQVSDQKKLIENYQQQIGLLNKTLDKANAIIQDFAQVRLLEFKQPEISDEPPLEQEREKTDNSTVAMVEKKKKWWVF